MILDCQVCKTFQLLYLSSSDVDRSVCLLPPLFKKLLDLADTEQ